MLEALPRRSSEKVFREGLQRMFEKMKEIFKTKEEKIRDVRDLRDVRDVRECSEQFEKFGEVPRTFLWMARAGLAPSSRRLAPLAPPLGPLG